MFISKFTKPTHTYIYINTLISIQGIWTKTIYVQNISKFISKKYFRGWFQCPFFVPIPSSVVLSPRSSESQVSQLEAELMESSSAKATRDIRVGGSCSGCSVGDFHGI
jgi:hypothetical protein